MLHPKNFFKNLSILGLIGIFALLISAPASAAFYTEDFESGYTLGANVGAHSDWYDGGGGPVVTDGIGVLASNGLAPANAIFTWTAHPFDWNDPDFRSVIFQMDFQTDGSGQLDDDRVGWMIAESTDSDLIFGIQIDPEGGNTRLEGYWDHIINVDENKRPVIDEVAGNLLGDTWYRLRAEITKLDATSAMIYASLTELDGSGNPVGPPVLSGTIPDTSALTDDDDPDPAYFTGPIWPAYKNHTTAGAPADNACFEIITEVPTQHTLIVNVVGSGSVTKNPDQALYDLGDIVELTAVADPGWEFSEWSGNLGGSANPDSIIITGDMVVTATFVEGEPPEAPTDLSATTISHSLISMT